MPSPRRVIELADHTPKASKRPPTAAQRAPTAVPPGGRVGVGGLVGVVCC